MRAHPFSTLPAASAAPLFTPPAVFAARRFKLPAALAAPLFAAALLASAAAPAQAVTVTAGTASNPIAGQTVDIPISTQSLGGLGVLSYQFVLTYNAAVVTAVSVLDAGTLPANAGWGGTVFNVTSGSISVSNAGVTALSGAGNLVVIRFTVNPALTAGGFTGLNFQTFTFNEGTPMATTVNGSITVLATPTITVSPNSAELVRGQTLAFGVSGSVTLPVTWGTTNPAVATIASNGVLTGVSAGAVRVFAVDNAGLRDTTDSDVLVRGMAVSVGSASVVQGQTATVPVTVTSLTGLGIRAGQFTITYNPSLVTPSGVATELTLLASYGPVTLGVGNGTLTVDFIGSTDLTGAGTLLNLKFTGSPSQAGFTSLTLTDALFNETLPAKRSSGSMTVNGLPTITVSPDNVTLLAGQQQQFTVSGSVTPPVTWSTLDPSVATIDATGKLTAVAGGVTKVQAVDNVGASDQNNSVTVYDFQASVPTITALPGVTVQFPIAVDRDLSPFGILSCQYTLIHNASYITDARVGAGLVSIWGPPFVNKQSDRISVAQAGTVPLGGGSSWLQWLELVISPSTPLGTNIPLVLSGFLCNEGKPSALVVNGLLQIRNTVDATGEGATILALLPAQPNPFASATRIAFTLPQAGAGGERVRLAVYGLDGRRVRMLVDGVLAAGRHEAAWDGTDEAGSRVAAGVYFVRLEANGRQLARKVVLAR